MEKNRVQKSHATVPLNTFFYKPWEVLITNNQFFHRIKFWMFYKQLKQKNSHFAGQITFRSMIHGKCTLSTYHYAESVHFPWYDTQKVYSSPTRCLKTQYLSSFLIKYWPHPPPVSCGCVLFVRNETLLHRLYKLSNVLVHNKSAFA